MIKLNLSEILALFLTEQDNSEYHGLYGFKMYCNGSECWVNSKNTNNYGPNVTMNLLYFGYAANIAQTMYPLYFSNLNVFLIYHYNCNILFQ